MYLEILDYSSGSDDTLRFPVPIFILMITLQLEVRTSILWMTVTQRWILYPLHKLTEARKINILHAV
jgi:hypothetical protein